MKIGFIGLGKMGFSIASGIVKANLYKASEVYAYEVDEKAKSIAIENGFNIVSSVNKLFNNCQTIVFSIKPQEAKKVIESVGEFKECTHVISIMAGIPISQIQKVKKDISIARVMPNTCAMILQSASSVCYNEFATQKEKELTSNILNAIGTFVEIDEKLMDDVIPIGGSFTAYAYTFMKAFIESSVKRGISREVAEKLVIQSMIGSANMVKTFGDIETLIKNVCSKGGTTLAGLEKFEENEFEKIIDECAIACAERSKELGKTN